MIADYYFYLFVKLHVQVKLKSCAQSNAKRKRLVSMTASAISQEGYGVELWQLKLGLVVKKTKGICTHLMEVKI